MQKSIQLAIHAGHGLHNVAQFNVTGDRADARLRLRSHLEVSDLKIFRDKAFEHLLTPEVMVNEKQAALNVLRRLDSVQRDGKGLSIATFSSEVVTLLVNAMYELDRHTQTVVVLHARGVQEESGEVTVHGMCEEGWLLDWPYGALTPSLEHSDLAAAGFGDVYEIHRKREELSRRKRQEQGGAAGEEVVHICNHPSA